MALIFGVKNDHMMTRTTIYNLFRYGLPEYNIQSAGYLLVGISGEAMSGQKFRAVGDPARSLARKNFIPKRNFAVRLVGSYQYPPLSYP